MLVAATSIDNESRCGDDIALDTELFGEPAGVRPGCIQSISQPGSSLLTNTTIG